MNKYILIAILVVAALLSIGPLLSFLATAVITLFKFAIFIVAVFGLGAYFMFRHFKTK